MQLYELNQAGYASLPPLSKKEREKAYNKIIKFLNEISGNYYMMLNHNKRYFTLFTYGHDKIVPQYMGDTILEIAESLGTLKAVEDNGHMLEFWIDDGDSCDMYALFNYDRGVIEV